MNQKYQIRVLMIDGQKSNLIFSDLKYTQIEALSRKIVKSENVTKVSIHYPDNPISIRNYYSVVNSQWVKYDQKGVSF